MSMILAEKCGVDEPVLQQAIEKSHRFFGFFVNKGSIPCGDHAPYYFLHDNQWLQIRAANVLADIGQSARETVPVLLKLALAGTPGDPREHAEPEATPDRRGIGREFTQWMIARQS